MLGINPANGRPADAIMLFNLSLAAKPVMANVEAVGKPPSV